MSQYVKLTSRNSKLYNNNDEIGTANLVSNNNIIISNELSRSTNEKNILSTAINFTEYNRALVSEASLSTAINFTEYNRALASEAFLSTAINFTEYNRALASEAFLSNSIKNVISNSMSLETSISTFLSTFVSDAPPELDTLQEINIALSSNSTVTNILTSVTNEINRATTSDNNLFSAISNEIIRGTNSQISIANSISTETNRASSEETRLFSNISTETSRATSQETRLAFNVQLETARAVSVEAILSSNISIETNRASLSENTLITSLSNINLKVTGITSVNTLNKKLFILNRSTNITQAKVDSNSNNLGYMLTGNLQTDLISTNSTKLCNIGSFTVPNSGVWHFSATIIFDYSNTMENVCVVVSSSQANGTTNKPTDASGGYNSYIPGLKYEYTRGDGNINENRHEHLSGCFVTNDSITLYPNVQVTSDGSTTVYFQYNLTKIG